MIFFIGSGVTFIASESHNTIQDKVMFGPNVIILWGDHNNSVIGKYMYDVKEKNPLDAQPVLIQKDVWIGAIILKGVTIGQEALSLQEH